MEQELCRLQMMTGGDIEASNAAWCTLADHYNRKLILNPMSGGWMMLSSRRQHLERRRAHIQAHSMMALPSSQIQQSQQQLGKDL